jgi:putative heme transporter
MTIGQHGPRKPTARWHKVLGGGASLVLLVVILVEVVPKFASYSHAWAAMTHLNAWWWVAIAGVALVNQISGVWPYQAALPGLRFWDGFLEIETTGAIANTVPAGGAVAIGMTYKMFSSFSFSAVDISTAVIATGIWNFAAKLGLPVAAVTLLAITAHPTARVLDAAIAGVVAMVVAGVALWLLFRFGAGAHWLGRLADRVVNWVRHFFGKPATDRIERSLSEFKSQTTHIVRRRAWPLTWTTLANQLVGFVLVLIIVRAVGVSAGQVSYIAVFTSFAIARLAGAIPITPGGLGTLDAAFISLMTAFGASSSRALAADLIWRLMVYLLPIIPGIVTYVIWLRRRNRSNPDRSYLEGAPLDTPPGAPSWSQVGHGRVRTTPDGSTDGPTSGLHSSTEDRP